MTPVVPLSAEDEANLLVEDLGAPMHIAALVVLEPDAHGEVPDVTAVRARLAAAVHDEPLLRRRLQRRGAHGWAWVDATVVDLDRHVVQVDGGTTEASRLAAVCAANEVPLDRSVPLWQVVLVPGAAHGPWMLLLRVHHALADGAAAIAMFAGLFDADAEPVRAVRRRARPRSALLRGLLQDARVLVGPHEGLSIDRPVGRRRCLEVLRVDLPTVQERARALDVRIDDLLMTAAAEGLRALLRHRGEPIRPPTIRVSVAATLRRDGGSATGNRTAAAIVPVPLDEPDPLVRLRRIAIADTAARAAPLPHPMGRTLQRWTARTMPRQRLVHLLVTNVPGPAAPMRFLGAPVLELFPVPVLQGNLPIAVGALSFAGRLGITVLGDPEAVPDLDVFAHGLSAGLAALGIPAASAPTEPAPELDRRA